MNEIRPLKHFKLEKRLELVTTLKVNVLFCPQMRVYLTRANTAARALQTESSTTTVNVVKTSPTMTVTCCTTVSSLDLGSTTKNPQNMGLRNFTSFGLRKTIKDTPPPPPLWDFGILPVLDSGSKVRNPPTSPPPPKNGTLGFHQFGAKDQK